MNTSTDKHTHTLRGAEYVFFFILFIIAVTFSLFQIWQIFTARLSANVFRPIHLTWVLIIAFFYYPLVPREHLGYSFYRIIDVVCALVSLLSGMVILLFDYNDFSYLVAGLPALYLTASIVFFLLLLEITRRSVGSVMLLLVMFFVLYNFLGRFLPGRIAVKSFTVSDFFSFQIYSTNGVFGLPLGIAAGIVFIFILFGALLEVSGAGDFFTNISLALTGRFKGGPAKASVIASALLGSISGSAIANAVTTGSFTIPLMKKIGYQPEQAAGIEAAASTGGQIMPPIMGAGAFIMAQFTGVPYGTIVLICFIPALLYFFSTMLYVHIMAHKLKLLPSSAFSAQKIYRILKAGAHSSFSILAIFLLLVLGFSPALVGLFGCAIVILISFLRKHTRMHVGSFLQAMKKGAILSVPVSISCAAAGVVVGVVGQTGFGLQITNFILSLSQGYLLPLFLLTTLMALLLGMGLPVTASYILLSIVSVPGFAHFGVPIIVAHIIVFWLSQTSNVTPPIALAAFAAAGVAKSHPMKSASQAFKLSSGLILIPLLMLYTPLIFDMSGGIGQFLFAIGIAFLAIFNLAIAVEGYLFYKLHFTWRIIIIPILGLLVFGTAYLRVIAFVLGFIMLIYQFIQAKKRPCLEILVFYSYYT